MPPLSPELTAELGKRLRASRAELTALIRSRLEDSEEPAAISVLAHMGQNDDMPAADMLGDNELRLLGHEENSVREIDTALARLEAGTAGTCVECGQPIAEARLLATPTVQTCISCQEMIEHRDHTGRGPSM